MCLMHERFCRAIAAMMMAALCLMSSWAAAAHDYQVPLDNGAWVAVSGKWQEYFGMNRFMLATDPWQSVRAPGGTGWQYRPLAQRTGIDRPRVMTGTGTIKLDLIDMFNGAGFTSDAILTKLQDRTKTGIFNMFDRVPSYPVDRDEAYWTYRLLHEFRDPTYNKTHLFIQLGNEINGVGQWNPWPTIFTTQNDSNKIRPYVEAFFVEAVKGLYQASRDVYNGNKDAIQVLGPSVADSFKTATQDWTRQLMNYTIQGSYTDPVTGQLIDTPWSGMEGQQVWQQVDYMSIQYPFAGSGGVDTGRAVLDSYYDEWVGSGRIKGLWITEELYAGGPRHLVQRAARYMDWIKDKNASPTQSRLLWYLPDVANDPSGLAKPAAEKLAQYMADGTFSTQHQVHFEAEMYLFLNDSDPHLHRIMVIFEPHADYTLGGVRFYLPAEWANLPWTAEGYQTLLDAAPVTFNPAVLVQVDQVRLDFQRQVYNAAPVVISLTAAH